MSKPVPMKLSSTIKDPAVVSIHEASHAVCALAKGLPLDFVTMTPAYAGGFGGATFIQRSHEWCLPGGLYVYLAGKVGTEIYLGRECTVQEAGASADLHSYMCACWRLTAGDGGLQHQRDVYRDYEATRRILRKRWPLVLDVAEALRAAPVEDVPLLKAGDLAVFRSYAQAPRQHYLPGDEVYRLYTEAGYVFWQSTPVPPPPVVKTWATVIVDDVLPPVTVVLP